MCMGALKIKKGIWNAHRSFQKEGPGKFIMPPAGLTATVYACRWAA